MTLQEDLSYIEARITSIDTKLDALYELLADPDTPNAVRSSISGSSTDGVPGAIDPLLKEKQMLLTRKSAIQSKLYPAGSSGEGPYEEYAHTATGYDILGNAMETPGS